MNLWWFWFIVLPLAEILVCWALSHWIIELPTKEPQNIALGKFFGRHTKRICGPGGIHLFIGLPAIQDLDVFNAEIETFTVEQITQTPEDEGEFKVCVHVSWRVYTPEDIGKTFGISKTSKQTDTSKPIGVDQGRTELVTAEIVRERLKTLLAAGGNEKVRERFAKTMQGPLDRWGRSKNVGPANYDEAISGQWEITALLVYDILGDYFDGVPELRNTINAMSAYNKKNGGKHVSLLTLLKLFSDDALPLNFYEERTWGTKDNLRTYVQEILENLKPAYSWENLGEQIKELRRRMSDLEEGYVAIPVPPSGKVITQMVIGDFEPLNELKKSLAAVTRERLQKRSEEIETDAMIGPGGRVHKIAAALRGDSEGKLAKAIDVDQAERGKIQRFVIDGSPGAPAAILQVKTEPRGKQGEES